MDGSSGVIADPHVALREWSVECNGRVFSYCGSQPAASAEMLRHHRRDDQWLGISLWHELLWENPDLDRVWEMVSLLAEERRPEGCQDRYPYARVVVESPSRIRFEPR
jgi:hypothetical protein